VVSVTTLPGAETPSAGEDGDTNEAASAVEAGDELPEIDVDIGPPEVHPEDETPQLAEEAEARDESPAIEISPSQVLPTPSQQVLDTSREPEPSAPHSIDDAALTSPTPGVALESPTQTETAASPNADAQRQVPEGSWEQHAPAVDHSERSEQLPTEHSSATSGHPPAEQWAADAPAPTEQEQPPAEQVLTDDGAPSDAQQWADNDDQATAEQQPGERPWTNGEQRPPDQRLGAASQAGNDWVAPEGWPRADWVAANEAAIPASQGAPQRRGTVLRTLVWLLLVVAAFAGGAYFGLTPHGIRLATRIGVVPPRPKPPPVKAVPAAAPAKSEPESLPRAAEPTPADLEALEKKPAAERTLEEVKLLGDFWLGQRNEEVSRLGTELRSKPDLLADEETRTLLMKYIEDRATATQALTMLAQTEVSMALDLIYDVWIRSSERTETTRIAEALLYASDVRPHVSPALEVALALRTQPTACDQIRKLTDAAREHGDRRSAMLLVKTASREDCDNGEGPVKCRQCLEGKKRIRDVVKVVADREAPYF
jgi:hypothetical protein